MKICSRVLLFTLVLMFHYVDGGAQVLVHEEPRHHPVFSDGRVRILNVLVPPGDTSQYHIHQTPSVFIFLSNTEMGAQLKGEKATTAKNIDGRILYENLAPPHVRTHRVWNLDNDTMHVMDIELLFNDTGFVLAPLSIPGLELEIDNSHMRAYRRTLINDQDFSLGKQDRSFILVSLSDFNALVRQNGKTQRRTMKTGEFVIIKIGDSFSMRNAGEDSSVFVLIELPVQ